MIKSFIKTAVRNLIKNKVYSLINIFGLSISIAAVILIMLYVSFELSYDDFHKDIDSIYRVSVITYNENKLSGDSPVFTPPIGPALHQEFAGVENYTRHSVAKTIYFSKKEMPVKVDNTIYADSTFLSFFTFNLIAGSPKSVLVKPYSIVLTETTAFDIFGTQNIVGHTISDIDGHNYEITGVVKDPPANSSIQFSALISFSTLYKVPSYSMGWNGGNQYLSYVKLAKNTTSTELEKMLPALMWKNINKDLAAYNVKFEPYLQKLREIHALDSGGFTNIYIFSAVGLLILLIASINFINLTTAQYTKRAKEIGIRKVVGASRKGLILQFLTETMLVTFLALAIGLVLTEVFSPLYRDLMQTDFSGVDLLNPVQMTGLVILLFVVGLIAGSYPAFYLSSFEPAKVLKKRAGKNIGRFSLQNLLITAQFAISCFLVVITLVVSGQLDFIAGKKLGYNKDNIIFVTLGGKLDREQVSYLKQRFSSVPGVLSVAASSDIPSDGFTSNGYFPEGYTSPVMIKVLDVDKDFLDTYDLKLIQGRNFSKEFGSDKNSYIVNESLAKEFGWDAPVGKQITRGSKHEIIGVVNDFNYASLHEGIAPLIITEHPYLDRYNFLSLRIKTSSYRSLFRSLDKVWQDFNPSLPFEYNFLDDRLDNVYKAEANFMQLFFYFSTLAIIIAGLGLFSIASLSAEQRTKEIGVRKVLGAQASDIIMLMTKEYLMLVLIANVIAFPVSYYYSREWLSGYAFKMDLGLEPFLFALGSAIILTILAVGYRAVRVVSTDMIKSLKYD